MFCDNLIALRKMNHLSQEELAFKIDVSRQTISKYETGEAFPDIMKCRQMAELFQVSLDDFVNYDKGEHCGLNIPPRGKHMFGVVKVGAKGQIVIPAKARKVFQIQEGDNLIVLGDESQGLAIVREKDFMKFLKDVKAIEAKKQFENDEI